MRLPWTRRATLAGTALLLSACAGALKPPNLQVERMSLDRVRLTGAAMDVSFRMRNPNPEPLLVERFEYDLTVNGHRLGRGYHPDPVRLEPFRDERVRSRFDVNFLNLPGTVKAVLDRDRVRARVRGKFYVRRGGSLRTLRFDEDADVDMRR